MVRLPRSFLPDGLFHVTARGNRRTNIYRIESDASSFLDTLELVDARHEWECFAWCLMPNHYHLVVRAERPKLSDGMRELNGLHAQRFNRTHGYRGHLFQGRFHSKPIVDENYLASAIRYVVLNPVRAGISRAPEAWPWSSYRATVGLERPRRCLEVDPLLLEFASSRDSARRAFAAFVHAAIPHLADMSLADAIGDSPGDRPRGVPAAP